MKVNFNLININRPVFKNQKHTNIPLSFKADTFERIQKAQPHWDKNRIKKIYRDVWRDFIKEFPVINEIGAKKPAIVFEEEESEELASYSFFDNRLSISPFYDKDFFFISDTYDDGTVICTIVPKKHVKSNFSCKNPLIDNLKAFKINDSEKELIYKSIIAHELRHFLQDHLLASCDDTRNDCAKLGDEYRDKTNEIKNKIIETYTNLIESKNKPCKKKLDTFLQSISAKEYGLDFKPKKQLPKDYRLSLYSYADYPRSISVKDHLLPAKKLKFENAKFRRGSNDLYWCDPSEIDAFAYEAKYIIDNLPLYEGKVKTKMFEDYVLNILCNNEIYIDGFEDMGYPTV